MGRPSMPLKAIVGTIVVSVLIYGTLLLPHFNATAAGNDGTIRDEKEEAFDRDCKELATRLRSAAPADRPQLQQSLRRLVEKHFEYRQSQRTAEIARLNERIQALKLMTARRGENRSEVIDRRLKDLTDSNADLNWSEPDPNGDVRADESTRSSENQPPDLAKSTESTRKSSVGEPTFKDVTLSKWIDVLRVERSPAKLSEALEAIQYLSGGADPRTLVRAIIDMSRLRTQVTLNSRLIFRGEGASPEHPVTVRSVGLLFVPKPEAIVVDELVRELDDCVQHGANTGFQVVFREFVHALASYVVRQRGIGSFLYPNVSKDSLDGLCAQIRRRAGGIASALANIAEKDATQRNWVLECGTDLIELSGEPLSAYPVLIPVFKSSFRDEQSEHRITAALVLCQSGVDVGEILEFAETKLNSLPIQVLLNSSAQLLEITACIASAYPYSPAEVVRVIDRCKEFSSETPNGQQMARLKLKAMIIATGELGEAGKNLISYLRSLEQAPEIQAEVQRAASEAIKKIESAKPKPKREPLSAEDMSAAMATAISSAKGKPASIPHQEKTFDGIPYSQWLKMLETERKPEKLANAIEACARLADPEDERRIARGIILAANLFETGDFDERVEVWTAAWSGLHRLPAQATVDELLTALRDGPKDFGRRRFAVWFIAYLTSPTIGEAIETQADAIVVELLRLASQNDKNPDSLIAAATTVWRCSDRSINEFPGLNSVVMSAIEKGPSDEASFEYGILVGMRKAVAANVLQKEPGIANQIMFVSGDRLPVPWIIAMANVIQVAPETPNLALNLSKCANRNNVMLKLIGMLGPRAEPAVAGLVDLFLEDSNKYDEERRELNDPRTRGTQPRERIQPYSYARCLQIVETLGQIGAGEKGYILLRELCLVTSPNPTNSSQMLLRMSPGRNNTLFDGQMREAARQAIRKFAEAPKRTNPTNLLKDEILINGEWNLASAIPSNSIKLPVTGLLRTPLIVFLKDGQRIALSNANLDLVGLLAFEIDGSKNPKEIVLSRIQAGPGPVNPDQIPETRHLGIYELTETTLRIQLAKPGLPRPTEFFTDDSTREDGQTFLEFERKLDE